MADFPHLRIQSVIEGGYRHPKRPIEKKVQKRTEDNLNISIECLEPEIAVYERIRLENEVQIEATV